MRRRLTDVETLMWGLDQHPMLASTMGSIMVLAGTPDLERLRTSVAHAVADVEALHHRVSAPTMALADQWWEPDPDFDLDHHLRVLRVPARSTAQAWVDLATQIVNDPFDRSRPPWSMTLLTGLPRGRAALVVKIHHAVADGQGAIRLGSSLFDVVGDAPPRPPIDLTAVLAERLEAPSTAADAMTEAIRGTVERVLGLALDTIGTVRSAGQAATSGQSPAAAVHLLTGGDQAEASVSPLWCRRSRNRRSLHLQAALPQMKAEAARRDCSVNDLFVTAGAEAALGYHHSLGVELDHVSATVVVSTRTDDHPDAHNAVVPCGIVVPGVDATTEDRLRAVRAQVAARRAAIADAGASIDTATRLGALVPNSIAAAVAADRGRTFDMATSNLPGPPIPLWLAGHRIEWVSPIGPLGGTAYNITMLSFLDTAALGLHYDPTAVADASLLASELRSSLARLRVDSRSPFPPTR